jgi:hypothetical protein
MKPATALAAVLLLLVAIAHALRLLFAVQVTVGTTTIPMWVSGLGTLVPAVLAIGLWRERGLPPKAAV